MKYVSLSEDSKFLILISVDFESTTTTIVVCVVQTYYIIMRTAF